MSIWQTAQKNGEHVRETVIAKHGAFSLKAAAAMLNIKVIARLDLPTGISSMIVKHSIEDEARVYLNADDCRQRQRFALAHAMGHYVEQMVEEENERFSFSDTCQRTDYDLHELYADHFAYGLLMPTNEVAELGSDYRNPLAIALRFDVLVTTARDRLRALAITN